MWGGGGDPLAKEAPALMRRGPLWLQSKVGPRRDVGGEAWQSHCKRGPSPNTVRAPMAPKRRRHRALCTRAQAMPKQRRPHP